METFVGLMMADTTSFLRAKPLWKPCAAGPRHKFLIPEFIKCAREA
jgi:hypothetical protein